MTPEKRLALLAAAAIGADGHGLPLSAFTEPN